MVELVKGQVAVVTGGASGIGLALAERFARGEIDEDEFRRRGQAMDESKARHPSGGTA